MFERLKRYSTRKTWTAYGVFLVLLGFWFLIFDLLLEPAGRLAEFSFGGLTGLGVVILMLCEISKPVKHLNG